MASLLLEDSDGRPGSGVELGDSGHLPPTGFNRLVFGDKFDAVFPNDKPATFMRLQAEGNHLIEQ